MRKFSKMLRWVYRVALALLFGGALVWMVLLVDGNKTDNIQGFARVVDGDSLEIAGTKIRIVGIDAPELDQSCTNGDKSWACGQSARTALVERIGRKSVHCVSEGKDKYRRALAVCKVDGTDLGKWMITHGWAVSYGEYSFDEAIARRNRLGLWQGEFEMPKDWRQKSEVGADLFNPISWLFEMLGR